ncbi:uncharacterized protein LOC143804026 [Ranitomeya variabilis]|uniref:uncharacterized protein LOC143804026 n=1 Tax=Ranitomeya variabilis TaxID=490064 RepID=UPI004055C409
MEPGWKTRPRFVCSNIQCLKISGVILLITIVLFLALQILKTSESERYSIHEIPFISKLLPFNNGDGVTYGLERSDNNYVREQDIASELLSYLQKDQLSERLKGPRWKEVLMTLKSRMRSKTDLTEESDARSEQDKKSCQPKNNIFFLKTHKTASSSIMNILFRYGEFHNLTFAFPTHEAHYSYPSFFRASYVNGFSEKTKKIFNIMCHHMRFKITEETSEDDSAETQNLYIADPDTSQPGRYPGLMEGITVPANTDGGICETPEIIQESASALIGSYNPWRLPSKNDYKPIKLINFGAFGAVHLMRHKDTNLVCAMKKIDRQNLNEPRRLERAFLERDVSIFADCPFVASMFCSFATKLHLCMVMEPRLLNPSTFI